MSEDGSKGIIGMFEAARASTYTSTRRQQMPLGCPCDVLFGSVRQGLREQSAMIWSTNVCMYFNRLQMHRDKSPSRSEACCTQAQAYPGSTR